jgi:hypothetical protein
LLARAARSAFRAILFKAVSLYLFASHCIIMPLFRVRRVLSICVVPLLCAFTFTLSDCAVNFTCKLCGWKEITLSQCASFSHIALFVSVAPRDLGIEERAILSVFTPRGRF